MSNSETEELGTVKRTRCRWTWHDLLGWWRGSCGFTFDYRRLGRSFKHCPGCGRAVEFVEREETKEGET